MAKEIQIGVGDAVRTVKGFIDAWKRAERGEKVKAIQQLNFENLEMLLRTLTSGRWLLLKTLRANGPMSIRALAKALGRDYKNVHTDVRRLEQIGLIARTQDDKVHVPWDIVEARLSLAA
jgi:predicted transcriptional regulator